MAKTWDLSSILRGKALAVLFATTAMFAGAPALAPAVASAERTNCTTEPQGCDGGSSGGGDAGSTTGFGATSAPGTGSDGFDNPFGHDPSVDAAVKGPTQSNLLALDPIYIAELEHGSILGPDNPLQIARFPGDLSVLTEDCRKLSFRVNALEFRTDALTEVLSHLGDGPAGDLIERHLHRARYEKFDRSTEFQALECRRVLTLDGRD